MTGLFSGKNVLITGGTGYLGRHLVKKCLELDAKSVRVLSRDEVKHYKLSEEIADDRLRSFVGDVRDLKRLEKATIGADVVIHAAAMKRIDLIEYNVFEAIKTNVLGTMNLVDVCLQNNVEKVVLVSTDKACSPINTYGATKLLAERIFVESNYSRGETDTAFCIVRYGNVTESTGSVLPLFVDKIKKNEVVPLTDSRMTRFFITPEQAVNQVLKVIKNGVGGEIFVPKLPSFKIVDLIEVLRDYYHSKSAPKLVGIRPGEKIDEWMINEDEATRAYEFGDGFVVLSQIDHYLTVKYPYLKGLSKVNFKHYSSGENTLSQPEIKKLLVASKILS